MGAYSKVHGFHNAGEGTNVYNVVCFAYMMQQQYHRKARRCRQIC